MGTHATLALPEHVGQPVFADRRALAAALAERVAALLREVLAQRSQASLVLSAGQAGHGTGGSSTP